MLFSLCQLLYSCAKPLSLNQYPQRQIDRPYTLTKGLMTWKVLLTSFERSTEPKKFFTNVSIFPFNWEQGFTDSVTVLWSPLPLQLYWQSWREDNNFLGFNFDLAKKDWLKIKNYDWNPALSATLRRSLSQDFSLESIFSVEATISRQKRPSWLLGPKIGILHQLYSDGMLGFFGELLLEKGKSRMSNILMSDEMAEYSTRFIYPLGLNFIFSLEQRWQIETSYQYISAFSPSSSADIFTCRLSYYW